MIIFRGKKYELFFSNDLLPFWALHYSDGRFFFEFKKLCGGTYKILSIIQKNWQQKYVDSKSVQQLSKIFKKRFKDKKWLAALKRIYAKKIVQVEKLLQTKKIGAGTVEQNIKILKEIRDESAVLDAMSNMLHMLGNLCEHSLDKNFAKFAVEVKDGVSKNFAARRSLTKKAFAFLARQCGLEKNYFEFLSLEEIDSLLLRNKTKLKKIADERKKLTVLFFDSKLKIVVGNEAAHFLKLGRFREVHAESSKFIKGTCAWPGRIVGEVVVVNNIYESAKKMKAGRILVSPYTGPEYVPFIKMAKAIVTDTGGITSHAAIVARELKIPCMTGTKTATKVFKDGDMVEVDAEKGIVRKIM